MYCTLVCGLMDTLRTPSLGQSVTLRQVIGDLDTEKWRYDKIVNRTRPGWSGRVVGQWMESELRVREVVPTTVQEIMAWGWQWPLSCWQPFWWRRPFDRAWGQVVVWCVANNTLICLNLLIWLEKILYWKFIWKKLKRPPHVYIS